MAVKVAPLGYKFAPTDEVLLSYYLHRRVMEHPLPPNIVLDRDVYQVEPWRLFEEDSFDDSVRYFFTRRRKRFENGGRPNREAVGGCWKATGGKKHVFNKQGDKIGATRTLVFVEGEQASRPESSGNFHWIMHEYWLEEDHNILKFIDWVICRIKKDIRGGTECRKRPLEGLPPNQSSFRNKRSKSISTRTSKEIIQKEPQTQLNIKGKAKNIEE